MHCAHKGASTTTGEGVLKKKLIKRVSKPEQRHELLRLTYPQVDFVDGDDNCKNKCTPGLVEPQFLFSDVKTFEGT